MAGNAEARMNIVRDPDGLAVALPDWRSFFHGRIGFGGMNVHIPRNEEWHIISVWAEYISDATQGNRQIVLEFLDVNGTVHAEFRARVLQTGGLTRYYQFAPTLTQDVAFYDTNFLGSPMPPDVILGPAGQVFLYDNNNTSPNDRIDIRLVARKRLIG